MMHAYKFELQIIPREHADAANYSSQVQFAIALATSCFVYAAAMELKILVKCDGARYLCFRRDQMRRMVKYRCLERNSSQRGDFDPNWSSCRIRVNNFGEFIELAARSGCCC